MESATISFPYRSIRMLSNDTSERDFGEVLDGLDSASGWF
jgi:hypothetical protein